MLHPAGADCIISGQDQIRTDSISGTFKRKYTEKEIARSRFELLSGDPESPMIDRYTTGLCASYFYRYILIKVTDCPQSSALCPPALLAGLAHLHDRENELSLSTKWFNIVNIAEIVDVGD
jgi:hypothetical protein